MKNTLHFDGVVGIVLAGLFLTGSVNAQQQFNNLTDAAVEQAKIWQSGGKSHALMSSDGKIIFAFGQSMPKLTCSPTRACDIEMEPGEKVRKVIIGDGVNWHWDGADSIEKGETLQHIIVQPKDRDLETNAIITTDRRTYHIKLYSPKVEGAYINRAGFYYPEKLVSAWTDKVAAEAVAKQKEVQSNVLPSPVLPQRLAFDYEIFGTASFKPLRVFNDGERVYMEMPESLNTGENPVFLLIDEKGMEMVVNYRREVDPSTRTVHYIVDKLFASGQLRMGAEVVKVDWLRKRKSFWGSN